MFLQHRAMIVESLLHLQCVWDDSRGGSHAGNNHMNGKKQAVHMNEKNTGLSHNSSLGKLKTIRKLGQTKVFQGEKK